MESSHRTVKNVNSEPRYVISIAAKMLGVETHTLRYYERIGIIEPQRSRGHIRLYSDNDIAEIRRAKALIEELGVNLAGVEVIMRLLKRMNEMQAQMVEIEHELEALRQNCNFD